MSRSDYEETGAAKDCSHITSYSAEASELTVRHMRQMPSQQGIQRFRLMDVPDPNWVATV